MARVVINQASATLSKEEALAASDVQYSDGFYEKAYRLLFAFEDNYASTDPPQLLTILPSGTVENDKKLKPEKEKGLLAYAYTQTIDSSNVEILRKTHGDSIDPFIQRRDDGTFSIVQTWPTSYNEAWRKNFIEHERNPSEANFQDLAAKEFHEAMVRLFGEKARLQPVKFAVSSKRNGKPVYLGRGDKLMQLLRSSSEICSALNIPKLLDDGFVTTVVCKGKDPSEKEFHMNMKQDYALYTKQGYETMACCKPLVQFEAEATLGRLEEGQVADTTLVEIKASATLSKQEALAASGVGYFDGFYEKAYLLLFEFQDKHALMDEQRLLTILPSGTVENNMMLKPEKEKQILTYAYTQTIDFSTVESLKKTHGDSIDPFIQQSPDGSFCLVQTWTKTFNQDWNDSVRVYEANPNKSEWQDLAAKMFHKAMVTLFGKQAHSQHVKFVFSSERNDKPVYCGRGEKLMQLLRSSSEVCNSLGIPKLLSDGFVTMVVRKDKAPSEREVHMSLNENYALYIRQGYETMVCCRPLEQFINEAQPLASGSMPIGLRSYLPPSSSSFWMSNQR